MKSYTGSRLASNSTTLNDLERHNRGFYGFFGDFGLVGTVQCVSLFFIHGCVMYTECHEILESSHSPQVPPPRQCYWPGGVTIFALPAVPLCSL